ncbi:hypothetical protein [Saccharolobus islandicus]|uniref:Conserved proviral protein n=1 Tax=Saccharolobus islandicus (strain REY15A) TaxID=930945 RepID=F0NFS7_SACI5|nr:hypothetical protein [Sulfolobus islandicus]ADX86463.1 conserved proviral protein [Sulfolobus islandicus REY15A]
MRKELLSLTFLALLLIPTLGILPSAQTSPNTWVIAFYPGSYPSGTSPSNFTSFTVNFTIPPFLQTSNGYLGFVLTDTVPATEYIQGIYVRTVDIALQIGLIFVTQTNTYVLTAQVWTPYGTQIYGYAETIYLPANTEAVISLIYNYANGHVAIGLLQGGVTVYNVYFPTLYSHNNCVYNVTNNGGFSEPSGQNPSFAIEGTYTGSPPFNDTGWDGMWFDGAPISDINAVTGYSSATGVGGTASIPPYYAESGLTLFHNVLFNYWYNPYAWYFSIGTPQDYSAHGLHYIQLSEGKEYNTINGLNYALQWVPP